MGDEILMLNGHETSLIKLEEARILAAMAQKLVLTVRPVASVMGRKVTRRSPHGHAADAPHPLHAATTLTKLGHDTITTMTTTSATSASTPPGTGDNTPDRSSSPTAHTHAHDATAHATPTAAPADPTAHAATAPNALLHTGGRGGHGSPHHATQTTHENPAYTHVDSPDVSMSGVLRVRSLEMKVRRKKSAVLFFGWVCFL